MTFSDFYVQVDEIDNVIPVSEMVRQALSHLHNNADYTVKVPLERLRLAESEKRRRQIPMGSHRRYLAAGRRHRHMNIMWRP